MTQPWELTLTAAVRAIGEGSLAPSAFLESCLERIAQREPDVQAWELLDVDAARRVAREKDAGPVAGLLYGVPIGIKDIIDVEGLPTGCGTPLRAGHVADRDAWVVAQARDAGAVVLGKTVTTEFAAYSPNKTRNPWDVRRTPGGSSSGSAAAIAAGMVPFAFGTQTAGSTIRPASFCGIAGYVLPSGRFDRTGIAPLSSRLDTPGLLTRTVGDLALVRAAMLGRSGLPQPIAVDGPRLLLCIGEGFGVLEDSMRDAVTDTASRLSAAGATVQELVPDAAMVTLSDSHATIMAADAALLLAPEHATGRLSDQLQELLDTGAETSDRDYHAALAQVHSQRRRVLDLLEQYDAILAPAAPGAAPIGMPTGDPAYCRPWHVLGLAAVSVPGYLSPEGMPLGMQVVGHPDREERLLAVAEWVESQIAR